MTIVDFIEEAQTSKTYDLYTEKMKVLNEEDLTYFGIGIKGDKKLVKKLNGSFGLLR
ncbi:DUF2000 domain-containing protein [Clostridium sp. MSJ-4]|uniref:DUF2000 domain-containing protein n=1 Tax=Clostridium simiarum TaxID=2841506 RepID=A0ABS6F293_9CLOT|nr:DUF2000 family protein [Clostridium simiarum]MBU5592626.1 DUF2000 domain-containing protein [Clostridium simiarum]